MAVEKSNPVIATIKKLLESEKIRFLLVGGFCFVLTMAVNYGLKFTILTHKPTTALLIATMVASVVSYILSAQWTWKDAGGGAKSREMVGFILVTLGGIVINAAPQWISRYVFHLEMPYVTFAVQEFCDFMAGPILGTLLAMVFRYWALDRFVFHGKQARQSAQLTEVVPLTCSLPTVDSPQRASGKAA